MLAACLFATILGDLAASSGKQPGGEASTASSDLRKQRG